MATKKKALQAAAGAAGGGALAIEDVFSTYLYTGQSAFSVVNGLDMATHGGAVWIKNRSNAKDHRLFSTGLTNLGYHLTPNLTSAEANLSTQGITSFNSDGWSVGTGNSETNASGWGNYTSWTFRKAPRFFDVVTFTGDGTGNKSVPHNLGVVPGFYTAKTTAIADNWFSYHRSLGATKYVNINSTGAAQTNSNIWGDTEPTDTHFTIGTGLNVSGRTYVIYLFAHDPLGPSEDGSDGLIACGSYTGTGANGNSVSVGWEPQWVLVKRTDVSGYGWFLIDNMRGMPSSTGGSSFLRAELTNAESTLSTSAVAPTPTGLEINGTSAAINASGGSYIYIAIRRGPMRQPTSGTEVYNAIQRTGTGGDVVVSGAGFTPDISLTKTEANNSYGTVVFDRMRGQQRLRTHLTDAEYSVSTYPKFDVMDGFRLAADAFTNGSGALYNNWFFKRAPGFFDVVAYGSDNTTSQTISHNLTVTPEMFIVKVRDTTSAWGVYHKDVGNTAILRLNSIGGPLTGVDYLNNTSPTETDFTVGTYFNGQVGHPTKYIAYLFATLPGVSKVGSYTGNGTNQTINCGFTSGARFILIKRTDSTGDWYIWDTERGIVAGNDPHISLNSAAYEVTSDDTIDPDSSGFIVNQVAATNVNVSSATYIFLAIA